jgi:hypothetical protein
MFARQVCFRKVQNSTFDIDDSGDDENGVSVDDLLAQAATDPDNDGNASDEERGSPLSAGIALAPANTTYRNTLLCIFYDAAQAARDRLSAHEGEQAVSSSPPSQPSLPPMSPGPSQTTMTSSSSMQSQALGQRPQASNVDLNRADLADRTSSAGINSNGKRPHTQLPAHDKENLEHPLPPVHVSNKKPRGGGGPTKAGRGGHSKK